MPTATVRARRVRALGACLAMAAAIALCLVSAGAALAENAQLKEEFAPFLDCPTATAGVCAVADTTSGEIKMGNKSVPIEAPITLQGGLAFSSLSTQPLIAARDGDTMISPPQRVPGGLIGIEAIGGEVTATAQLAGTVQINQYFLVEGGGVAVVLPLKVKLDNPLLGEECWIGSDSDPIVLHLSDADKGKLETVGRKKITKVSGNTLVDESFTVPAATGCGTPSWLITPLVNLITGLPAAAGANRAVLSGSFEQTTAAYAAKYAKQPKEKKHG